VHPFLIGAPIVPAHPYNLDQLISEDGTVTIEQPILSVEEETFNYFLLSSSSSATTLLPGQDKPTPSGPMSGAFWFVVSCGARLSEVGLSEIRKPQARVLASLNIPGAGAKLVPKHHDTP
jgi:hypothetical protein